MNPIPTRSVPLLLATASLALAASHAPAEHGPAEFTGPRPAYIGPRGPVAPAAGVAVQQIAMGPFVDVTEPPPAALLGPGAPRGYRAPFFPFDNDFGLVTSEADLPRAAPNVGSMNGKAARDVFETFGEGVKIGVISDSYNALGGAVAGVRSGDLPGLGNPYGYSTKVTVLRDYPGGDDEGRGMIELIYDLAPRAEIYFYSAYDNDDDADKSIAIAVEALRAAGCDVICDDITTIIQPAYQDGHEADSYNRAFDAGIACFTSAGNDGDEGWEGFFNPVDTPAGTAHNWSDHGVDTMLDVLMEPFSFVRAVLIWDDPYPSVGAQPGWVPTDLDMRVFYEGTEIASSLGNQVGGDDPWEYVGLVNDSPNFETIQIYIEPFLTYARNDIRIHFETNSGFSSYIYDNDDRDSSTIIGSPGSYGAVACAAMYYRDPDGEVEYFSSRGDRYITLDHDGNRIDELRPKPDVTATDGANTTFFGFDSEPDGRPNFFGTSAAAPHAAAAAALAIGYARDEFNTDIPPATLYELMKATASPVAPDNADGAGLVDCLALLQAVDDYYRVPPCPADLTTTHANPGDPGYGVPDGVLNGADLARYVELWVSFNPVADYTSFGTNPGDAFYGFPDGFIDGADLAYYVEWWLSGCL